MTDPAALLTRLHEAKQSRDVWEEHVAVRDLEDAAPDLAAEVLALRAENERLRASLKRMLLEFDFLIEANMIADVRNDIIFVQARAALTTKGEG